MKKTVLGDMMEAGTERENTVREFQLAYAVLIFSSIMCIPSLKCY